MPPQITRTMIEELLKAAPTKGVKNKKDRNKARRDHVKTFLDGATDDFTQPWVQGTHEEMILSDLASYQDYEEDEDAAG